VSDGSVRGPGLGEWSGSLRGLNRWLHIYDNHHHNNHHNHTPRVPEYVGETQHRKLRGVRSLGGVKKICN
jgi:hypothetical protein